MSHNYALNFTVSLVVEPDDGGFHAYAPALKGLHVDGATEDEAVERATEAVGAYIHSLIRHGDPLPVGPDLTVRRQIASEIPADSHLRNITIECPSFA